MKVFDWVRKGKTAQRHEAQEQRLDLAKENVTMASRPAARRQSITGQLGSARHGASALFWTSQLKGLRIQPQCV